MSFSAAQWTAELGVTLFAQADKLLVNGVLGPAAAGIYAVSRSVAVKVTEIAGMFLRVLPPAVSAANALGDRARVRHLYQQTARLNGVVCVMVACSVMLLADIAAALIAGKKHGAAVAPVIRILILLYAGETLFSTSNWFAVGLRRPSLNAVWCLSGRVLMCVLIRVLASRFGIAGAAWANAGYLLSAVVTIRLAPMIGLSFADLAAAYSKPVLFPDSLLGGDRDSMVRPASVHLAHRGNGRRCTRPHRGCGRLVLTGQLPQGSATRCISGDADIRQQVAPGLGGRLMSFLESHLSSSGQVFFGGVFRFTC